MRPARVIVAPPLIQTLSRQSSRGLEQMAILMNNDAGLPCLCKACLPTAGKTATAGELAFTRSFAVAGRRVLHFWMLADQDRATVRASVRDALAARLAYKPEKK